MAPAIHPEIGDLHHQANPESSLGPPFPNRVVFKMFSRLSMFSSGPVPIELRLQFGYGPSIQQQPSFPVNL